MGGSMRTMMLCPLLLGFSLATAMAAPTPPVPAIDPPPAIVDAPLDAAPVLSSCAAGAPTASPEQIAAFRADPLAFATTVASTDQDLSAVIGNMIIQDPTLLVSADTTDAPVATLLSTMAGQKYALARGLGLASVACVDRQPEVALAIQELAAGVTDTTFQEAFLVAIDDIKTAALGPGGGTGGGDIGSGGTIGGGTGEGGIKQGDFTFNTPTAVGSSRTSITQTRPLDEIVSPTSIGGF
jgi:hypothetical protein